MKQLLLYLFICVPVCRTIAQKPAAGREAAVPCNGDADLLPGKYTDHTNPKYPSSLKGTPKDKTAMIKHLITLEKLEEKSRSNFQLTGCVARVSFSGGKKRKFGKQMYFCYGYQLGIYQNVCHVTERIVKTVDEYRTVLRVDVNPNFTDGNYYAEGGDFYVTNKSVRYDIPIDAKRGPNYEKDRIDNRSRITQYISESMVLTGRSDNYKDKQGDFLQFISGNGYIENWLSGSRIDKPKPNSSQWIDRHYLIKQHDAPLLIPVTRKEYLESLLEYYELEKSNFLWAVADKLENNSRNSSICEADKIAYQKMYEYKKEKVKKLLAGQKTDWLQKQAVVNNQLKKDDYSSPSNGLLDFDTFRDGEEKAERLYRYNPAYFETTLYQPAKPMVMEVQFRYETGKNSKFSERFFQNFLQNYDFNELKKMTE